MSKVKTRWVDMLPPQELAVDDPREWGEQALWWLRRALINERTGHPRATLANITYAAANVRAWRRSLPQTTRVVMDGMRVRDHLTFAGQLILEADSFHDVAAAAYLDPYRGQVLRSAEAHLRTAGGLLIDQEAAELVGLEAES